MKAIPEGFHTLTPALILKDAAAAIALYKKAFNAKEIHCLMAPNSNKVMHACLQIGSSMLFLCDTMPEGGCAAPTNSSFYVYMDDVDSAFRQAKQAGLQEMMAPEDMFWGDRMGNLKDPFGIMWSIASHVRDVSPAEMQEGMRKMMAGKAA